MVHSVMIHSWLVLSLSLSYTLVTIIRFAVMGGFTQVLPRGVREGFGGLYDYRGIAPVLNLTAFLQRTIVNWAGRYELLHGWSRNGNERSGSVYTREYNGIAFTVT